MKLNLSYSTDLRLYDEDNGTLYRDCRVSVNASGDPISMEYIKNMVATMDCCFQAIIEDTEINGGVSL